VVEVEPFYFTSYERVVGIAGDVRDLDREMKRLAREDRPCLEYHLANGHIVSWLEYTNEPELARDLTGVKNAEESLILVERYVARSVLLHRRKRGRMH
jgi:hypothetical protein